MAILGHNADVRFGHMLVWAKPSVVTVTPILETLIANSYDV